MKKIPNIIVEDLSSEIKIDRKLMQANLIPTSGISKGVVNVSAVTTCKAGVDIPFGFAHLGVKHVEMIIESINAVAKLDIKIREGFKKLFISDPIAAGFLVRKSLNLVHNQNLFIENLIKLLSANPDFCTQTTTLYRLDGLDAGNRIIINELNANPIGGIWLSEVSAQISNTYDSLGIEKIPNFIVNDIRNYTLPGESYFLPVRNLNGSSSYSEKIVLQRKFLKNLNIKFFMGELNKLIINKQGAFVKWENSLYKIGFMGGLSSPEIFQSKPNLLGLIERKKIYCPSVFNNILGLCNKGVFTIITAMRESQLNPGLLGLSMDDLNSSNSIIPNTYWLLDAIGIDRTSIFIKNRMVAKPINGVGGKGVIFSNKLNNESLSLSNLEKNQYLIQEYFPSFQTRVNSLLPMQSSLDPYFVFNDGKARLTGVLVRSALPGMLPNLTKNSRLGNKAKCSYMFSLGVRAV